MLLPRISRARIQGYSQQVFFENLLASVMGDILGEFPQEVLSAIERMWPNVKDDTGLKAAFMGALAGGVTWQCLSVSGHRKVFGYWQGTPC